VRRHCRKPAGHARRIVIERLARAKDEPPHAINTAVGDHDLRAAPVVEAQRDIRQVETIEELGQNSAESPERQVRVGAHGPSMCAHGKRWRDTAKLVAQVCNDVTPLGAVH